MNAEAAMQRLARAAERSGLIGPASDGVVLASGGADSACAVAAATAICGPESVAALHVNYGLRDDAERDERAARALCAKFRIDLHIERPALGEGNLQARAREARYAAAEQLRARLGADWIATGHTRTDLAETVLYRLAVSPGTRALLGMAPRSGAMVRPLLALSREQTRRLAQEAGLPFCDDPSNAVGRFARNRIRHEVMPVLTDIGVEAERNIVATHDELRDESELLARIVAEALEAAGSGGSVTALSAEAIAAMEPALQRLSLRALAERAAGRPVALDRRRALDIARLVAHPEGGVVELPGGVSAHCESGWVRFQTQGAVTPEPVLMRIPGSARFGDWELRAELREAPIEPVGPELATLDLDALGDEVEIRAWRNGDRIKPLGLGGSKSLQDVFTDTGVPRSLRSRLPVIVADGRVAWVAGVAVSEEFRLVADSRRAAVITARAL